MNFGEFVDVKFWTHFLEELAEMSQTYVYTFDRSCTVICHAGKQTAFFHLVAQTDEYQLWRSELAQKVKNIDVVCDPAGFTNVVWALHDQKNVIFGYCVISSLVADSAALFTVGNVSPIEGEDCFVFVDHQKLKGYVHTLRMFERLFLPSILERKKKDEQINHLTVVSDYLSQVAGIVDDKAFVLTSLSFFVQVLHFSNCAVRFEGQLYRHIQNEKIDSLYNKVESIAESYCNGNNPFLVVDGLASSYLFNAIPGVRVLPQSLIAVPLSRGVLFFYNEQDISDKLSVIVQLSQKFDRAFCTVLHYKSTEHVATTDPLTGIFNRAYFMSAFESTLAEAHEKKMMTSLAIFDVDDFKKYNDTFGHSEGDRILREIVSAAQSGLSHLDILARYGGEEFVILFSDVVSDDMYRKVQELCHLVQTKVGVTVSIGLAVSQASKASPEELIKAADGALYQAKSEGKNRVVRVVLNEEDEEEEVRLDRIG